MTEPATQAATQHDTPRGVRAGEAASVLAQINSQTHDIHRSAPLSWFQPSAILIDRLERGRPSHNHKASQIGNPESQEIGFRTDFLENPLTYSPPITLTYQYLASYTRKTIPPSANLEHAPP
jgi:hypothetical protein